MKLLFLCIIIFHTFTSKFQKLMKPTIYFLKETFFLLFLLFSFTAFSLTPDNPLTQLKIKENTYQKLVLVNTLSRISVTDFCVSSTETVLVTSTLSL